MTPNPGYLPSEAIGKRVRGKLANGAAFGFTPISPEAPAGWPADGGRGCNWRRTGHPFDIAEFEVIG